jgi:hypothetical protein
MAFLRCFWMKRWLAPYVDGALSGKRAEAVASHLRGCSECRGEVSRLERLRGLVRATLTPGPDPDWTGFWDGVRSRILRERRRPWREAWGWSPGLALGGALAALFILAALLWPMGPTEGPGRPAGVVVNAVETAAPDGNLMVFSSPEDEMTVIWVFGLDRAPGDETRIVPVSWGGNRS